MNPVPPEIHDRDISRLESFSDGVIAIAITLLALELRTPNPEAVGTFFEKMIGQWPHLFALITSFTTISILWMNHRRMFRFVTQGDVTLMLINALLLLCISLIPYTTGVLAEYLQTEDAANAALVYGGWLTFTAFVFHLLWRRAARRWRLLHPQANYAYVRQISRDYRYAVPMYLGATLLSLVSVPLSLAAHLALAVFFALPRPEQAAAP